MENKFYQFVLEERERLENKAFPDYQNDNWFGKNFIIKCDGNADKVMEIVRNVLLTINYQYDREEFLPDIELKNILPKNFISKFSPEKTEDEIEEIKKWWFSLSIKQKIKNIQDTKDDAWSFGNWIYWFAPEDRLWFWWGAVLVGQNNDYFVCTVKTMDELFLTGALKWLFIAAGAIDIQDTENYLE